MPAPVSLARTRRVFAGLVLLAAASLAACSDAPTATRTTPQVASLPNDNTMPGNGHWVSGYWVGYLHWQYPPSAVSFANITHIIVGALQPTTTGGVRTDFYMDSVTGPQAALTISTRAHAAGRKAILMLGGGGLHDQLASASSSLHRATFVKNVLAAMDSLHYDGIDVDWEPVTTADEPTYLALMRALRAARPSMILTTAVNWAATGGVVSPVYAQVASYADQVNLMTYEMSGHWGGWMTWHSSALGGDATKYPSSVEGSVAAYEAAGVPAAKLGIGLGFYGQCWRGVTQPRQAFTSTMKLEGADNAMSYAHIMTSYYAPSAAHYDSTAQVPWLAFATETGPRGCTYVSYEDPTSIAAKGAFVKRAGLGGAILWNLEEGHVASMPAGQRDPLAAAAWAAIAQ